MFENRLTLFRLFGFPIKVDWSWLVIAFLVTWSLAVGFLPAAYPDLPVSARWIVGLLASAGLFFSIVAHEVSHALVARSFDMPIKDITLFIFGGVAQMQDEPTSPKAELLVAVAGPAASGVLAGLLFLLHRSGAGVGATAFSALTRYLWRLNLVVAIFNLLPAFPLDGGRILRSLLWAWRDRLEWATRAASIVGSVIAFAIMGFGFLLIVRGGLISGIWLIFIGFMVRNASRFSYRRLLMVRALKGEHVRRFMKPDPITVPPGATVEQVVEDYIYEHHFKMFPVVKDEKLMGCVTTANVKQVPREEWRSTRVDEILSKCTEENSIDAEEDAVKALSRMNATGNSRLMVTKDGRLAGIVALKDMLNFLSLKLDLESEELPRPGRGV